VPSLAWVAVVRVGCFLGGCCFGDVCGHADRLAALGDPSLRVQLQRLPFLSGEGVPTAVRFPAGSLVHQQHLALGLVEPGAAASLPVHPVQLYEAGAVLLLALLLVRARPRLRQQGGEALAALGGYALIAFLLELLRADNALVLGPLTADQLHYAAWGALAAFLAARATGPCR
jgi:phosphatidylglycerol:prolipoprotein diacylglycerol transferase